MPLTLHPDLDKISRMDFEVRLSVVRSRRMIAAVNYYQGKNAKIQSKIDKADRKLMAKYEMMGKALEMLDKAILKVEKLAHEIEQTKQERGLNEDQIQFVDTEEGYDE